MSRIKKVDINREEFFSYFKVEQLEDGTINAETTIKHEEFQKWMAMVFDFIQNCFDYKKVKNYLTVEVQLGKQKIEFSLLSRCGTGPHALRMMAEKKLENIQKSKILEILHRNSDISNGITLWWDDLEKIADEIMKLKDGL